MNVQPMALEMSAPRISPSQNTRSKSDDPFSSALSKAQDQQENKPRDQVKNNKKSSQTKDQPAEKTVDVARKEPEQVISTKETSSTKEVTQEETMAAEQAAIEALAQILQMTPGELEQLLGTLQVGVLDLLQADNLQQLIMEVHGVDEPMDLLLISEIASEIKMVTSLLEEHGANHLGKIPSEVQTENQLEINTGEEILSAHVNTDKSLLARPQAELKNEAEDLNQDNKAVGVSEENAIKVKSSVESEAKLSQNEEEGTPSQNTSANNFLETLSGSIGEAFQMQAKQVGEVNEAVPLRHEVIEPKMVLDQIVERIKVSVIEEEAQMNIQLKPEHLGKLSMEVISKQGSMTARFTVENERVKEMIEQNIQDLKEVLEARGLIIEKLEVAVGQHQQDNDQANKKSRSNKNISNIIDSIMNEELLDDPEALKRPDKNATNEVDFTA